MNGLALNGPRMGAASGRARHLAVFLHGYGADGADLISLAPHIARLLPDTAFAAPNAPDPCASGGNGWQWFPVPRAGGSGDVEAGMERAERLLRRFLAAELERLGLTGDKLALVGFSQGTMMALRTGLSLTPPPAAILGFSGALAGLPEISRPAPPVLLIHGDSDPMIPPSATLAAAQSLAEAGVAAEWHISKGTAHSIAPDGLDLAGKFLARHLASRVL